MIYQGNQADKLAVVYLLFGITTTYIIFQLPFSILGLKYSTSIEKINKIIQAIDKTDVDHLANPNLFYENHEFEEIEENRIILLKDIGVNAIKDSDWILPQTILTRLYKFIPNAASLIDSKNSLYAFLWMCKHFLRTGIKHTDHTIVHSVTGHILVCHNYFSQQENDYKNHTIQLDSFFKEMSFSIILSEDFDEIRDTLVKNFVTVIEECIYSLKYTDEELPTQFYLYNHQNVDIPYNDEHYQYWNYLQHYQLEILVDVLKFAMNKGDERVYQNYHWRFQHLIGKVESSPLTEFQKITYLYELIFRTNALIDCALKNELYEDIEILSHIEIVNWIKKGWDRLYGMALYNYSRLLGRLIKLNAPYERLLDEFFMIGRTLSGQKVTLETRKQVYTSLIESGLKFYENINESNKTKYDIQHQLNWLYSSYIEKDPELVELVTAYGDRVKQATQGYNYWDFPTY